MFQTSIIYLVLLYIVFAKVWTSKRKYMIVVIILCIAIILIILNAYYSFFSSIVSYFLLLFLIYQTSTDKKLTYAVIENSLIHILATLLVEIKLPLFRYLPVEFDLLSTIILISSEIVTFLFILFLGWLWNKNRFLLLFNEKIINVLSVILPTIYFVHLFTEIIKYTNDQEYLGLEYMIFLIMTYSFVVLIIFIIAVQTILKNEKLNLDSERKKIEYESMGKYADEISKQYNSLRKFRHDYINILSSLESFIKDKQFEELETFYYQKIQPTKLLFNQNMSRLNDLQKIENVAVRGVLSTKLFLAQQKNRDFKLEVHEEISGMTSVDTIILVRILGILMDNAIEELEYLEKGELIVALFNHHKDVIIIIQNNARENIESIAQLKKEGFSTKGKNRGLGLTNIDELISQTKQILLETSIKESNFTQKLTIMGEE